jgi:putative PIN family toxin of toxin-antitoxin system
VIKVVFDTNILISSLFWKGPPYNLMKKVINGEILLITSQPIINEMRRVLLGDFNISVGKVEEYADIIISNSIMVSSTEKLEVIKADKTDNRILERAISGRADYIVSGDRHLLSLRKYKRIKIIKAAEMIEILKN